MAQEDQGEAFEPTPMAAILTGETTEQPDATTDRQPVAAEAPVVDPKGEPEPADQGAERDEHGRFKPKDKPAEDAAPPAAEREPDRVPVAALKEERAKRQAAEQEMARMRQFLEQAQRQQQQPAQQPAPQGQQPAVDPIGALLDDPQAFVGMQVRQAVETVQAQNLDRHIAMSRAFVAAQASDYEAAEQALAQHVQRNPQVLEHVQRTIRTHPNPAQWALEQGRALMRQQKWADVMAQHGDPDAFLAARAAPAPAEAEHDEQPVSRRLPASLASARSAGAARSAASWSGPTPLSQILGPRSR